MRLLCRRPGLAFFVKAQGQALQVFIEIFAQICDDTPTGDMGHIGARELQCSTQQVNT